jgi:putative ABC transport system substrate-binding protein
MLDLRRRDFMALVGGAAAAWPLAARAQQVSLPIIGFLGAQTPELFTSRLREFRRGLAESGYVEGRDITILYRWAQGHENQLPMLVAELVRRQVAVIATSSTASTLAANISTKTIPIIFAVSGDPVQLGFVQSLNRPGGNLTGSTNQGVEAGPKRLELLHELLPTAKVIAFLIHPANPSAERQTNDHQKAARALGLHLHLLTATTEAEIDYAFTTLQGLDVQGLVIGPDNFFNTRTTQLASLALRHRLPAIFNDRDFAAAGGLISYGANISAQYRLSGVYVARILTGSKPGDLPVHQSDKVELVINLQTAKALGLEIPPTLLARADEVIE